jgi:hypothetical protein
MRFAWQLAALQRKLEWEVDMAKGRLAVLLGAAEHTACALDALEQTCRQQAGIASAALRRQAHPGLHAQALGYLAALQARIAQAQAEQLRMAQEVAAARAQCLHCQQRLDTLATLHDHALAQHLTLVGRRMAKEADLDWLAGHAGASSTFAGGGVQ